MSNHQAEMLTALSAATLWPQLRRLDTEVVATRTTERLMLRAGFAATGMGNLPLLPRCVVVGIRNGLSYQGVLVARQLAGGAAWEVVSLRILREKDDETIESLLEKAASDVAERGGRTLFLRMADGSPHAVAIRHAGLQSYARERLFAPPEAPPLGSDGETSLRAATRADRAAIFRLYCQAIPEVVRRNEAITQQEFRAVLDLHGCASEYVLDDQGTLLAWAAFGGREGHLMANDPNGSAANEALTLIRTRLTPSGTLVVGEHQPEIQHLAAEHGFNPLGTRILTARRLAALNPLKEALAVPATSRVPN